MPNGLARADESSRIALKMKTIRNIATGVAYEFRSRKATLYSVKLTNMITTRM